MASHWCLTIGHLPPAERSGALSADAQKGDRATEEFVMSKFPILETLLNRRAALLSGGEQQVLALAKALMMTPQLLLIDEMSLGLAPIIVESLMPIVQQVATDWGTAVLLVEQHADLALEFAHRIVVLNHGEVTLEWPSETLRNDRDQFEAAYSACRRTIVTKMGPEESVKYNLSSHQPRGRYRCISVALVCEIGPFIEPAEELGQGEPSPSSFWLSSHWWPPPAAVPQSPVRVQQPAARRNCHRAARLHCRHGIKYIGQRHQGRLDRSGHRGPR